MESCNNLLLADAWPLSQLLQHGREVEITPTLARRILSECESMFQPPEQGRIRFMARNIRDRSLWNEPLLFGALEGKLIIGEGVDRLAGVDYSGIPWRFRVEVVPVEHREQLRKLVLAALADRRERHAAYYGAPLIEKAAQRQQPAPAVALPPSLPFAAPLTEILQHGREVLITPELAKRIKKECHYVHERKVKPWRVHFFVSEIKNKRFEQGRQISFALLKGNLLRMNGQHRLEGIIETGEAQMFMVEIKPVATEAALAALYDTYDTESRTLSETAGVLVEKGDLGQEQVSALLRAVQYLYTSFREPNEAQAANLLSHTVRNQLATFWYIYAKRYFALTEDAPADIKAALRRQSIVAVALCTLKYQPEKAAEFWRGLAMDDGLRRTDPRKALLKKLASGENARNVPFQMRMVAAAWNAFYEGRNLTEIRVDPGKPFRLAGTPVLVEHLDGELDNVA